MSTTVEERTPEKVGSRNQARELFARHLGALRGSTVLLDCRDLKVSTPSFVDELILSILVEGKARRLILESAPDRTVAHAIRSAELRGVPGRLVVR
jgi:hypothetical protein